MASPKQKPADEASEDVGAAHGPPADGQPEDVGEGLALPGGLQKRVEELERERDEYLDNLKRVAADFENYRKRAARDQQSLVTRAHERLVKELLPVLDDLERAIDAASESEGSRAGHGPPLQEGVELVARQLRDALHREGLTEIETDGQFDPHIHEALLSQPSEQEEGAVIDVLQKGYRLGDRVLRPARVVVSQGAPQEAS